VVGTFLLWSTVQGVFLVPADAQSLAGGAAPYRPLVPPLAGTLLNLALAAAFVWWFAVRPAARGDARRRRTFRLRPVPPGAWPWVGAAALAAAVAVNAATLVLPRFFALPKENQILERYGRLPGGALALLALAAVLAPLLEEFLFRGWLQGQLERRLAGGWRAILATAVIFAALHGVEVFGLVPRVALAVAAGYAAWATASIWPSVVLHGAYNAALFAGGAVLPAILPKPPAMEAWADVDRAAFFYWARDGRVFGAAAVVLALAVAAAAWALARVGALARDARRADPSPARPFDAEGALAER
jgi:membrane protease YdiL (CAAX protease family)